MSDNDPEGIRRSAIDLLLSKPGARNRIFGAVEFAGSANPLFPPGPVSQQRTQMPAALDALRDDGVGESDQSRTDYDNVGDYREGHAALRGPATCVVGLNIGPAGEGDEDADRLGRIAGETGATYFPLRLSPDDTSATQIARLQGVVNEIDAKLDCPGAVTRTTPTTLAAPNTPSPTVRALLPHRPRAMEVVLSWGTPTADVDLRAMAVTTQTRPR